MFPKTNIPRLSRIRHGLQPVATYVDQITYLPDRIMEFLDEVMTEYGADDQAPSKSSSTRDGPSLTLVESWAKNM